jgi:GNAT superfamily N-acetyltransferase
MQEWKTALIRRSISLSKAMTESDIQRPIFEVIPIGWKTVRSIWRDHLWPGRQSEINGVSSMRYLGGHDSLIYGYQPSFFAATVGRQIIGVISGFTTAPQLYRSRGIWIAPQWRRQGVSRLLFDRIDKAALAEGCTAVWSYPRLSALPAYLAHGFRETAPMNDDDAEFGPNCYVLKEFQ